MGDNRKPKCGECGDEDCRAPRAPGDRPFDPTLDAGDCFVPMPEKPATLDEIGRLRDLLKSHERAGIALQDRAEKAEAALAACERERETIRDALREAQKGSDEAHEERMKLRDALAVCERERDEVRDELESCEVELVAAKDASRCLGRTLRDLASTRAEAERLRGVIGRIASATGNALNAGIESLSPLYGRAIRAINNEAVVALSPATPAAPSPRKKAWAHECLRGPLYMASDDAAVLDRAVNAVDALDDTPAAPSSAAPTVADMAGIAPDIERWQDAEYRRGYERAVEDALRVLDTDCGRLDYIIDGAAGKVVTPGMARNAIRSLLPAPREVTEAEVKRIAQIAFHAFDVAYHDRPWTDDAVWSHVARAVLSAQGEGRGK